MDIRITLYPNIVECLSKDLQPWCLMWLWDWRNCNPYLFHLLRLRSHLEIIYGGFSSLNLQNIIVNKSGRSNNLWKLLYTLLFYRYRSLWLKVNHQLFENRIDPWQVCWSICVNLIKEQLQLRRNKFLSFDPEVLNILGMHAGYISSINRTLGSVDSFLALLAKAKHWWSSEKQWTRIWFVARDCDVLAGVVTWQLLN